MSGGEAEGSNKSQEGIKEEVKGEPEGEIRQETIDKDWIELGGGNQMQPDVANPGNDRLNSGASSTAYERSEIAPSFFCGCSGERQNVNQQQFVTYQRPINRRGTGTSGDFNDRQINVAYVQDPSVQVGCSMGSIPHTQQMVYLPFSDFCELLTFKLLN